ncbi:hypothetical protein DFQ26_004230 [Actinomortierella ambigua]|nr:hypothetical protein DFQ26_004230 [Actinomortierella ambigua]
MHRRLPLESVGSPVMEQRVLSILRQAGVTLLEQPYDRNMGGSYAIQKSRSEMLQLAPSSSTTTTSAPLERPVVLVIDDENTAASMWLIPEEDWVRYMARVRFWRQESHRIKAAERHATLVQAIHDRWSVHRQVIAPVDRHHDGSRSRSASSSSSGTLSNSASAPGSPVAKRATAAAETATIPPIPAMMYPSAQLGVTAYQCYVAKKDLQQRQQQQSTPVPPLYHLGQDPGQALLAFIHQYGDELSARSTIRGLVDFIRRQIGDPELLTWTIDSVNLTEQKLEITEAVLDLLVRLGIERIDTVSTVVVPSSSFSSTSSSSSSSAVTVTATVNDTPRISNLPMCTSPGGGGHNGNDGSPGMLTQPPTTRTSHVPGQKAVKGEIDGGDAGRRTAAITTTTTTTAVTMDELVWTFGLDTDDRQLSQWVEMLHQNKDPSRSLSKAIRDRYLYDSHTIAAGSVEPLLYQPPLPEAEGGSSSPMHQHSQSSSSSTPVKTIRRRPELVLEHSRWSKRPATGGQGAGRHGGGAVGRARKDLADLASRPAGEAVDSDGQDESDMGSTVVAAHRVRNNDENV